MTMTCPVCGSNDYRKRLSNEFKEIVVCGHCGVLYNLEIRQKALDKAKSL